MNLDLSTLLAALIPLGILIYWFTDRIKDLRHGNWDSLLTALISVGGAFLAVVLYAHSSIDIGGTSDILKDLSTGDQFLLCLFFAATAGTGSDVLRTFNNSDSTVRPRLSLVKNQQKEAA